MRDLASVELHFTKHSSVIAEKTSRTGGVRCGVFWGIESPLAQACLYKSSMMHCPFGHKKMKTRR
jgi:hypothetical protein